MCFRVPKSFMVPRPPIHFCGRDQLVSSAVNTIMTQVATKSPARIPITGSGGIGKSAVAAAVAHGYSNIFITSPSPENLKTLFDFIFKGMDALGYEEHLDYDIVQSTNPDFNKAIVRVNVFRNHRQTIQVCIESAPGAN